MVRPRKRRKMNDGVNRTRMDDLDDHMLTQILLRLPNCATVLVCSAVNKRWCSLISDPNFSILFANHKKKTSTLFKGSGSDHEDDEPRWTFITTMFSGEQLLSREFTIGSSKLLVKFKACNTFITMATFKDLVLSRKLGGLVYNITNPLTKKSVTLPPCPVDKRQLNRMTTSLICQPRYNNYNQDYKFRVVEIRNFRKGHSLDTCYLVIYCSEIGEWKEINLRVPKDMGRALQIVVCNGIVYFKSGLCLVGLDPFDVNDTCDTTLHARVMPPLPDFGYLKESSGQLVVVRSPDRHISPWVWYKKHGTTITLKMVVWKLDLNQAPLMWETTFQGLCEGTVNGIDIPQYIGSRGHINAGNIGLHPYDDKLIYMYLDPEERFVLCDTRTGRITSSESFPDTVMRFHRVEQQWWPTSVPALVQCLTAE